MEGVEVMDGPTPIARGPSTGPRFIDLRTPWGLMVEMIEAPAAMP